MQQAFAGIVDYAGLFPPASLGMAESVRNYEAYRHSPDRWALGRYVVAAMRLRELHETLLAEGIHPPADDPWHLSLVFGNIIPNEMAFLDAWRALRPDGSVVIDAVEFRVSSVGQIMVVSRDLPQEMEHFLEVPQDGLHDKLVRAIAEHGGKAKLRTGGSTPDLFPPADAVVRFIVACLTHKVPFKFTAGLHNAYRGVHPLTYKPDAEEHVMYGFIPLLLATAHLARGGDTVTAEAIISDDVRGAFTHDADGFTWRAERFGAADLERARSVFTGFGSCSFREPLDGIAGSVTA